MYQPRDIEDFYSTWSSQYKENYTMGESCQNYVHGDQWDDTIVRERSLRGEESFIFNLAQKQLLRVKVEAESL